ncbi:predicted protein [Sparassis crispa]|uniref:Uncharacterized protein n=1 Tax=Sparassis crispa TaxID=139825 RepID=A0A401GF02_9APHY|nr:predicted protein [Sparassis crispa]GBE80750.1 predicted protein [Sparassis crispa]
MNAGTSMMEIDMHLSQLFGGMKLDSRWSKTDVVSHLPSLDSRPARSDIALGLWRKESEELIPASMPPIADTPDALMYDSSDSEDSSYQPSPSASSSSTESVDAGCALLQAIREEVRIGRYPTTGGEYLEAIFTHREVFSAYPQGHRMCSVGFSDLAQDLEQRSGRADRDADPEVVAAFRHEAAWIAAVGW